MIIIFLPKWQSYESYEEEKIYSLNDNSPNDCIIEFPSDPNACRCMHCYCYLKAKYQYFLTVVRV